MRTYCQCKCGNELEKYDSRGRERRFLRGHQIKVFGEAFEIGHAPWNKDKKGIHLSPDSEFKKGLTPWNKGKARYNLRGKNNPAWKGGRLIERTKAMRRVGYRRWRRSVFERDNYTCQECGYDKGHIIQAHHIKSWALYPRLRYSVSNGVTLCIDCHKKTDSYLKGGRAYATAAN